MNNERELVQLCMKELCKSAGFADCSNIVQRDMEFLCDSIESKTGVLISLSTIRRLLNGQFSRLPQIATLNAMVQYMGYQHWQDFKNKKNEQRPVADTSVVVPIAPATITPAKRVAPKLSFPKYAIAVAILLLLAGGLLGMLKTQKRGVVTGAEKAKFSAFKSTRNDVPNTVIFYYNIDNVDADSFFIQQSWDRNRRVKIHKKNYTFTDIYYEPGYHTAKLIANDQIIKTFEVSIPTDRWFSYAIEKKTLSNPVYVNTTGMMNGSLQLSKEELINSKVDIKKNNFYVQVYFPTDIKYSSDNYRLTFRARVNDLNNNTCPELMSEVFCQKNFMYFISSLKGCSSEIKGQYGDTYLNGKQKDLSSLSLDVRNWQDVEVKVVNKKVTISFNNKEVFSTLYQQSGGMITGLGFLSNEICEVDKVKLETLDGQLIYGNEF